MSEKCFKVSVMMLFVFTIASGANGWVLFDDFSSGTIDSVKWDSFTEGGGNLPYVSGEQVYFTGTDTVGQEPAESIMMPILTPDISGIRADLTFHSFTPNGSSFHEGVFDLEVELGGDMVAAIGFSTDGSGIWGHAAIESDVTHQTVASETFAASFGSTYDLGIIVGDSSVEFYKEGQLFWSYAGAYSFIEAAIETVTFYGENNASFDNVQIIPEPATLSLLALGSLLLRRKKSA